MATYVHSGNVVFKSAKGAAGITNAIEREIKRRLGLDITVVLRTKTQLTKLVDANPFAKAEAKTLYVTLLAETPPRQRVRSLDPDVGGATNFASADGRSICTSRKATAARS